MIEHLRVDIVMAWRGFRTAPGTAAAMILTLAVAVGANLAMFGLIDRALLSPPAHVVDPPRLFTLAFQHSGPDGQPVQMATTSYVTFEAILSGVPAAAGAAAWTIESGGAVVDGEQVETEAMLVSGGYFPMLGARPAMGRTILPDDDRAPAGAPVAVLSHAFWRSTFAGDAGVLGRRFTLSGQDLIVVGVMPAGFSGLSATRADVWVPVHAAMDQSPGWDRNPYRNVVEVGLRVRAGQTAGAAAAQAGVAAGVPVALSPVSGARVTPAEHTIAYWLAAVSALVLLIGMANTATLLLVRGARRGRELGIRTALGASPGRLLSQLVVESAVLAAIAVAASLLVASWVDDSVRRLLLPSLIESSGVSVRMAAAAAIAGLCTIAVGAGVGAAQLRAVRRMGQFAVATHFGGRSRTLLLVQTTLAVVLLAGAGMFGRSLYALAGQDFGMRMDGVLLVHFEQGPGFVRGQDQLFASALERIRALPGVALATPVGTLPFTGFNVPPFSVPGRAEPPTINGQLPFLIAATPELFDILGLDVREGRRFTSADDSNPVIAIVNDTMARTIWPGRSALGECFRIGFDPAFDPSTGPPVPSPTAPCRRVVGVVRDVRQRSVLPSGNEARLMQYYVPFSQVPGPPPFVADPGPHTHGLMVRVPAGAETLEAPIRRLVIGGRTDLPFLHVRPYAQLLEPQIRPWRTGTTLLALFSGLALTVAAIGLYAAFAHSVGERRREMAVRIAVGARPRGVTLMILWEAVRLALAGVALGCLASVIAGRWTETMLYGTIAIDPMILAAAATVMLVVAAAATLVPAIAASRADPCDLLRTE